MQVTKTLYRPVHGQLCMDTMVEFKRVYSKACVKRPLKIDKTKILMTNGSLMQVKSIALEHSAILLTGIKG